MKNLIVIYDHPSDFPDSFVARWWEGQTPTGRHVVASTLEELYAQLPLVDRVRSPRHPDDDPVIVETWISLGRDLNFHHEDDLFCACAGCRASKGRVLDIPRIDDPTKTCRYKLTPLLFSGGVLWSYEEVVSDGTRTPRP